MNMDTIDNGIVYFWGVILVYASWVGGTFWYARQAHQRITELENDNVKLRAEVDELRRELRSHPLGFMRRAN